MEKLSINEYLDKEKSIQDFLLIFLDDESNSDENYQNLIKYLESQKIRENQYETKIFLHLLAKIAKYHYRTPTFFSKIEQIITFFKEEIKQTLSKSEIFNIFKGNKRILLYLINEGILKIDKSFTKKIITKKYEDFGYLNYFYPEIHSFLDRQTVISNNFNLEYDPSDFEQKRKEGENESQICRLIRQDSIDDFIKKKSFQSSSLKIDDSIFETNAFLLKNQTNLIEYAAFFGSINIFKYLFSKNDEFSPSLWLYAIHGKNMEIIHLIEKNSLNLDESFKKECLKEAIKCHSNDIAEFLINAFFNGRIENFDEFFITAVKYSNYHYFPHKITSTDIFYELCRYDYATIISDSLDELELDLNTKVIPKKINFFS